MCFCWTNIYEGTVLFSRNTKSNKQWYSLKSSRKTPKPPSSTPLKVGAQPHQELPVWMLGKPVSDLCSSTELWGSCEAWSSLSLTLPWYIPAASPCFYQPICWVILIRLFLLSNIFPTEIIILTWTHTQDSQQVFNLCDFFETWQCRCQ